MESEMDMEVNSKDTLLRILENEEVVRRGRWIEGVHEDKMKRFEDDYGNDLSVFDTDCLKGIERIEIGDDCCKKVTQFVIDGLNELKSIKIGEKSFILDKDTLN